MTIDEPNPHWLHVNHVTLDGDLVSELLEVTAMPDRPTHPLPPGPLLPGTYEARRAAVSAPPVAEPAEPPAGSLGCVEDLTGRHEAVVAATLLESRLRVLLELRPHAVTDDRLAGLIEALAYHGYASAIADGLFHYLQKRGTIGE